MDLAEEDYRRYRVLARLAFRDLVDTLNRLDTAEYELYQETRHPPDKARRGVLVRRQLELDKRRDQLENHLSRYDDRLGQLEYSMA